ncbi:CoA ester lyase [Rhodosalinus halophilus]|uniref:CoA ester lyase n=1 Tax=Rhodosalinus halophilus TaxID=2259333 RepID=A0A365U749_9RHOB|nr:CoA ester lyase [Rhodosalinus halophilus]RBI83334.1 CoA ester lyase [Rhodosalinus halophilus]
MRLKRSYLFVPGDSARKMKKAMDSGADALILDLEDAVAPGAKEAARAAVAGFLSAPAPMPRYVRVNALDTGLAEADVAAVRGRADGYVLPKCEGPADLADLSRLTGDAPVVAIATETVSAVRSLLSRDWTHPTLEGLAWGGEDLAADLGASSNRDAQGRYRTPFRLARDAMLFAAKEAGVAAIDAVFTDFRDARGLEAEAMEAEAVGFTGKLAIHPAQIAPIHRAFTPGEDRVAWARRVVAAVTAAEGGVATLDGQMLDRPHLRQARLLLERAKAG